MLEYSTEFLGLYQQDDKVENILGPLSAMMRYASKSGVTKVRRLSFVVKSRDTEDEVGAVEAGDIERLLAVADDRYRAAILLASQAGLRIGEIRALCWSDVKPKLIAVRQRFDTRNRLSSTKGNRARRVGLSGDLRDALSALDKRGVYVIGRLDTAEPLTYAAITNREQKRKIRRSHCDFSGSRCDPNGI